MNNILQQHKSDEEQQTTYDNNINLMKNNGQRMTTT